MKLLCLHSDFLEFEPVSKAVKEAEEIEKAKKRVEECLVCFACAEKGDEKNIDEKAAEAVAEIKNIANQIKVRRIVVYPFVHLSSSPAAPSQALAVLKKTEELLARGGYETYRAPFGWYKHFVISCKGHPLAEWSREIRTSGQVVPAREHQEEELEDEGEMEEVLVLLPNGQTKKRSELGKSEEAIERAIKAELKEDREAVAKKSPHTELMKKLEIAEPEPRVSDAGNLRYYPKGQLMMELLAELGYKMAVVDLDGIPVRTPYLINPNQEQVHTMMGKFPERLYKVLPGSEEKAQEFRLRPACDYGVWLMFKDATITYKQLPLPLYELDLIWRYEQRGELLGMSRVRCATMADLHTACANINSAFVEFERQAEKFAIALYKYLDLEPSAIILNCKRDFFNTHSMVFKKWAQSLKIPIIVKLFKTMRTYKVAWIDVIAFDNIGRPVEVVTVQLDTESAAWWGISYVEPDGKKKQPLFLHTGFGLERTLATLLENAASLAQKGANPTLPTWLSPTQVRIIPISQGQLEYCKGLMDKVSGIRIDLDDSSETLGKKIRNAELEWIPYVWVVGEKEQTSNNVAVRERSTGKQKVVSFKEAIELVKAKIAGMPFRPLPMPKLLSKRPIFVG